MEKRDMLYEGKAKKVFKTDDENLYIVDYKDDATAFNGLKKGQISGKGVVNNRMSNFLMQIMEKNGIPTHFVEEISDRETVVKKVSIVPLEVIVRNVAAGSFSKRLGVEEGSALKTTILEYCYKDDELGDPLINDYHAMALGIASREELDKIADMTFKVNDVLKAYFKSINIELVDFKIEFGRTDDGDIILADEISPDTCRLWDADTHEKLDKDRFRRDMGNVEDAYREVFKRLGL
ncbi:MAG: phosphoribosylaminoimidazolesuccinocarboxamide synthase [Oscillospiraceae bacterium]|nr:phosphoribosylaminoimidazolesuccinocarboxamide synthase [Oscillospiraceae bacterium]